MDKILFSLLIAIALTLIGVAGDFFIKLSGNGPRYMEVRWFIIGFLIYGLTAFGWFYVMKNVKLATLAVYSAVFAVLALVFISMVYFKEKLNYYEFGAIAMAVVSLIVLGKFAYK